MAVRGCTRLITGDRGSYRTARFAFTLTELIAVMIVTAILAITTIPSLARIASSRAHTARRELERDLAFARERAVATGEVTWVTIVPSTNSWNVRALTTTGTILRSGSLGSHEFAGVSLLNISLGGTPVVGFDWLGSPLREGGQPLTTEGTIVIADGGQIVITPGTGHVSWRGPS